MAQTTLKQGPANLRCTLTCWGVGLVVGLGATAAARLLAAIEWNGAVFLGALVFVAASALMSFLFCRPLPTLADVEARRAAKAGGAVPVDPGLTAMAGATTPLAAPAAPAPIPARDDAAAVVAAPPVAAGPAPSMAAGHAPPMAGDAATPMRGDAGPPTTGDAATPMRGDAATPMTGGPEAPMARPAAAMADSAAAPASVGVAPPALDAPRAPGPDDLTALRGVGPVLAAALGERGIHHFDQVAAWSPAEAAWIDAEIAGGRGRVMRDDWVGQARALVSGEG